mgnify:CR=1 FL=1|jgi:glycosyltransferase involved in cell wall biosynthesis|tara:strand:- start:3545 stop:4468 length:924 start_codon:yes stop_codon:yes gene_type:complete
MKGWLVHDYMTCIPNTRTLWYDLVDWLPHLEDKCNNGELMRLPEHVDQLLKHNEEPDYVIRNASYWPTYAFSKSKIISILQDFRDEPTLKQWQLDVCNGSDKVIAVSNYVKEKFSDDIDKENVEVLPIGTDFNFFKPQEVDNEFDILPNSILWIGDYNNNPKGFDILKQIIKNTNYNFCIVLKSNIKFEHKRIRCFNRISHEKLVRIMNNCKAVLCTSREETLHLSSIEAAACNLPVITSNIGIHYNVKSGVWGENVPTFDYNDYITSIDKVFNNIKNYTPRDYFNERYSISALKEKWLKMINEVID